MQNIEQQQLNQTINKLSLCLGDEIVSLLLEGQVDEIMLNADGKLFSKHSDGSNCCYGELALEKAQLAVRTLVSLQGGNINDKKPIIDGQIACFNTRFCALLPPLVKTPSFCLRLMHSSFFDMQKLISCNFLTQRQAKLIDNLIKEKQNLLICGQTSCGKTTFINALLNRIGQLEPNSRIVCIEDTPELQLQNDNCLNLYTNEHTTLSDLVKATLRLSPDRIVVGEVRGHETLDMVDAMSTGHKGTLCSIHAGSVEECMQRLRLLISRNAHAPKQIEELISLAIDYLVILKRDPLRHIAAIAKLEGFKNQQYQFSYL